MNEFDNRDFPDEVREIIRVALESQRAISEGRIEQDGCKLMAVIAALLHEQNSHPAEELEYDFA
ncbi:MAG: hypothetical protein KGZ83_11260 [Sulfuricella sp.]|nr:hypothetical protein [Sulfuricella sp.]